MNTYKLKLHSFNALPPTNYKHTGFWLEEYDNEVLVKVHYLDLSPSGSFMSKIDFHYDSIDNVDVINSVYAGETVYAIHDVFENLSSNQSFEIFYKIKIEAEIINSNPDRPTYLLIENNCNSSTEYFIDEYVQGYNGSSIVNSIPGIVVDGFFDFGNRSAVEDANSYLEDFCNFLNKNNVVIDYSKIKVVPIANGQQGCYLSIIYNNITYIYDDNGASSINNYNDNNDSVVYLGDGHNVVNIGNGDDRIYGGKDQDSIIANNGENIVYGNHGYNYISTGNDDDTIYGGNDRDYVLAGNGDNVAWLGAGSDEYVGGNGGDVVDGGSVNLTVRGDKDSSYSYQITVDKSGDVNTIYLGGGDDIYNGGNGIDIVDGGSTKSSNKSSQDSGNDKNTIYLGGGNDEYYGGAGIDIVYGEADDDYIHGGAGNDKLYGGSGNDTLIGGSGLNHIEGGADKDYIQGGDEKDYLDGGTGNDTIYGAGGNDDIHGGTGDDYLYGGAGDDNIWAGTGRDYISAGSGVNKIYCGNDQSTDRIYVSGSGIDNIYGATNHDYIYTDSYIVTTEQKGKNLHITLASGKKIILYDFMDKEDEDNPAPSDKGLPFMVDPDGNILGYSIPDGEFADTGGDIPPEEMPEDLGDDVPEEPKEPGPEEGPGPEPEDGPGPGNEDDDKKDNPRPWDSNVSRKNAGNLLDIIKDRPQKFPTNLEDNFGEAETTRSPLVLDLDGDGVETIQRDYSNIYFDHDGNGFAENTGWINEDDGLLVRDINGNGTIDNGSELFGNETILSNGQKADNGFEALKDLDSNNDGVFNADDAAWNEVKVWKDINSNGKVDEGELKSLEEVGVSAIDLNYNNQDVTDKYGNQHLQTGAFIDTNGNIGQITDVWFDTDTSKTKTDVSVTIPDDIKNLPNISGSGNVYDLHTAMALDTTGTLKSLVEQFIAETNQDIRQEILINIVYHWAGVQDMDPEGRNPKSHYGNVLGDSRKLEALEEFLGKGYLGTWCWGERDPNPHGAAAPLLLRAFNELCDFVGSQILMQSTYDIYLANISVQANGSNYIIDASAAVEMLKSLYQDNVELGVKYLKDIGEMLNSYSNLGKAVIAEFRSYGDPEGSLFEQVLIDFGKLSNFGTSGNDTLKGSDDEDIIQGFEGNDIIYGNGGNDELYGGIGNDTIFGDADDDYIVGGEGNDYLSGGDGADTYHFEQGFGHDSIYNNDNDEQGTNTDKILFGEGILASDVTFQREGFDLILRVSDNDSIRIYSYFDQQGTSSATVETIEFADGTIWDYNYILAAWNSAPSAGGGKILDGGSGNDSISGTSYDDIISGNAGDDTINAGYGNDIISGGKGNDILNGGYGDDIYYYNLGDGFDTITDEGNNDRIIFGPGINFSSLTFSYENGDLKIIINGDQSQGVLIKNFFSNTNYKIENLTFNNGTTVPISEIGLTLKQSNLSENVQGTSNNDIIYGNGGNDNINAGYGNDTLIGGKGDDILNGGYGDDTYVWNLGDGFDTITEYEGSDKISFGSGIIFEDLTFRCDGSDLIITVKGNEAHGMRISNQFSSTSYQIETLEFADGSTFNLSASGLTFVQTDANDNVSGTESDDIIYGNGGNDNINSGYGNDTLIGGIGNDYLNGGYGDDTYIWNLGDGFDSISESSGNDKIVFGEGITFEDLTFERAGSDLRIYIKGDKTQGILISSQFSSTSYQIETLEFADGSTFNLSDSGFTLIQTDANDNVNGTDYDDVIYGKGGNDTINSGYGNDTLIGGIGNDKLYGSYGDDTYIWNLGDGFDTISESSGQDKIVFGEGITFEDLTFERYGSDLVIYIKGNKTQGLNISNQFSGGSYAVETLEFADGNTFNLTSSGLTLIQTDANDSVNGTDYDDIIYGKGGDDTIDTGYGNDTLIGGVGNDKLYGGYGDDTYIWNLGDGFDSISENSGQDKIVFGEGITFEDLTFEQYGSDLKIYINGNKTQGLHISNQFYGGSYAVETLEFADGSTLNLASSGFTFTQTDANDNVNGTDYDDIIYGNGGNDTINSGYGNDTLIGGIGNDNLNGGYGDDTYVWNLGDGFDTIYESGGTDKIIFGEGISFENLTFERDGTNLKVYVNSDKTQGLNISNQFYGSSYAIETLEFADGSTFALSASGFTFVQTDANDSVNGTDYDDIIYGNGGDDTIDAGYGNDTLIGGVGNDKLYGGYGDDTYIWNLGDGFDSISENSGQDKIVFGEGVTFEDLTFEQYGSDLRIYVKGDKTQGFVISNQFYGGSYSIETIELANGATIDLSDITPIVQDTLSETVTGTEKDDILIGGNGNDIIQGSDGDDVLSGGKGNDKLYGSYDNDTYVYNIGDGFDTIYEERGNDKIVFGEGITLDDITFRKDGSDLIMIFHTDNTQGIRISSFYNGNQYQVETLVFADGSKFGLSTSGLTFQQTDANDSVSGTDYNDIIYGNGGNDTIHAGNGNDILIGGIGNDKLYGGYGDDTYIWNLGDGFDTISESSGQDKIVFGEGITFEDLTFRCDGSDLIIMVKGNEAYGMRISNQFSSNYQIETLEFADGSKFGLSTSGLTFAQTDANDSVNGTSYDDTIYGNAGNDTISGNDGNDTLIGGIGNDKLYGGYGDDTYVWDLGDGMDAISESSGQDKIVFGEGITFDDLTFEQYGSDLKIYIKADKTQGLNISNQFSGGNYAIETLEFADNSTFNLTSSGLTLIQTDANDNVNGTDYDDVIYGKGGNDTINSGYGNDTLIGGAGYDNLNGGEGDDTYIWNLGDGFDTISDTSGQDKIVFGEGISFEDLTFERDGENLKIYINGDKTQGLIITNHYSPNYAIEIIKFADGSSINTSSLNFDMIANDSGQTINGTDYEDVLIGGDGNDTLYGNDCEDVLIGGKGNDILQGGYGRDTYIYNLGDGFDTITEIRGEDKIIFGEGINPSDISFRQDGSDLIISIGSDAGQGMRITGFYSSIHNKVELIEFANGTIWDISEGITLKQTNADDNVSGTSYDDIIYGNAGNDIISGNDGNDTLIGGTGNDKLQGGYGNDTYVWNLGDGFDTITEYSGNDKILFGSGISYNNLKFVQDGNDLIVIVNNDVNQGMRITGFYSSDSYKVETLQFANGSTMPLSGVTLTNNDNLYTYNLNSGLMVINETGGSNAIQFSAGITMDTLSFARDDADNLIISVEGSETDAIQITDYFKSENNQVQTLLFADNTEFDMSQLNIESTGAVSDEKSSNIIESSANTVNGTSGDDVIYSQSNGIVTVNGGDGDDIISAGNGINTINGGNGNDILNGGNGINTFNAGTGDDIINTGNGINTINAGEGNDIIRTGNGINTIFGGAGTDIIYTGNGINEVSGDAGNDVIYGGLGSDTYIYNMGDGFDTIFETGGRDTLKFGEGIDMSDLSFSSSGNDLTIGVKGDAASGITIADFYTSSSNKVDVIEFSNGQSYDISKYNSADQLIQAMGAFGATNATSMDLSIEELNVVDNVIAGSYKNVA